MSAGPSREKSLLELKRQDRSTRGKRYKAVLEDEEAKADESFWNQDFFAEEQADDDYQEEHVSEDVPDSDFDEEADEDDDDDEDGKDEAEERPRKKALKPPGRAPAPRPKAKLEKVEPKEEEEEEFDYNFNEDEEDEEGGKTKKRAKAGVTVSPAPAVAYEAPSLRRSTIAKVTEAENERQWKVQEHKPRKRKNKDDNWRPMTQQELLADAARTEMENMASLKLLLAMEEETKRRATVVKKHYTGPIIKLQSTKVNGSERTSLKVCNMHYPPLWLRRMRAPPPAPQPVCPVTGLPAKYKDPRTGQPFANAAAQQRLRGILLAPSDKLGITTSAWEDKTEAVAHDSLKGSEVASISSPSSVSMLKSNCSSTQVDRTKEGARSQQARTELEQLTNDVLLQSGALKGPSELPLELMALVVELRAAGLVSGGGGRR
ncbi:hypothetical protein CEUSTIGMA_g4311.t1 [Chlamydomonas eustigma]|uniref:Vps72/YL1 C-terminal domain-containing protein n=1 Tax=Chlamydomonas eustigma TaxID=1157962 RepID=A0A250X1D2_9CHLO|nr:hypothetical protein CEUSTIGMA_g4311.t1 [Chlamydomonas eustigma]|eukprot:GAX76865.1 hypothetical protein CEUSTIGMA_g4311.t1 [Chlamydomonas eustigma]